MSFRGRNNKKIYIGNLPTDVRTRELEEIFAKYGKIMDVDIKRSSGPAFAFVEFDDDRDAEDAIRGRNGYDLKGHSLRVEYPHGKADFGSGGGGSSGRSSFGGGGFGGGLGSAAAGGGGRYFGSGPGVRRGGGAGGMPTRRSDFRVVVSHLPTTGSWQDLKDHMREAGDVGYTDVFKDGTGICEFLKYEDMRYAVKHLDDSKFKSHEGEISYIRVKEDTKSSKSGGGGGGRGRSRSRSRSRSPRSRSNSDSRSSKRRRNNNRDTSSGDANKHDDDKNGGGGGGDGARRDASDENRPARSASPNNNGGDESGGGGVGHTGGDLSNAGNRRRSKSRSYSYSKSRSRSS